jgi:hypothetical protein
MPSGHVAGIPGAGRWRGWESSRRASGAPSARSERHAFPALAVGPADVVQGHLKRGRLASLVRWLASV